MLKGLATRTALIAFSMLLIFSISLSLTHAQLGEVAGTPIIYVNISGTATHNYTFLNTGQTPLSFRVILPTLNVIKNVTSPVVTAYPMNGTIPESGIRQVRVTIYMPDSKNLKVGDQWSGLMQVVVAANASTGGGASISEGVAKNVIIQATPAVSNDLLEIVAGIVVAAAVVIAALYMFVIKPGKAPKKAPVAAAKAAATRAASGRTATAHGARRAPKKATSRKRKASGKGSGKKSSASRPRRRR